MSIIWTLRKYIDAIEHREEEAAQHRDRRMSRQQGIGDGDNAQTEQSADEPVRLFECRVCGYRASDGTYCPQCLAETMVELPSDGNSPK